MVRLDVPKYDARTLLGKGRHPVIDQVINETVGYITGGTGTVLSDRSLPGWSISLYGKYRGGFESNEECVAFAKGVEAVLNHMVAVDSSHYK